MPPIEIGKLQREFRPGMENLVAGVIIGLLLIGGGCVLGAFTIKGIIESRGQLPVWEDKGFSWGAACIFAFIVIIMIVGGALLIRWIWSLASLRVYVALGGSQCHDAIDWTFFCGTRSAASRKFTCMSARLF